MTQDESGLAHKGLTIAVADSSIQTPSQSPSETQAGTGLASLCLLEQWEVFANTFYILIPSFFFSIILKEDYD